MIVYNLKYLRPRGAQVAGAATARLRLRITGCVHRSQKQVKEGWI
jgi:hypothetical protein